MKWNRFLAISGAIIVFGVGALELNLHFLNKRTDHKLKEQLKDITSTRKKLMILGMFGSQKTENQFLSKPII